MPIDPAWLKSTFPDLSDFQPIAQGGQKVVVAAKHPQDGQVVIKIVQPQTDPETFRREILAVQRVNSPRVPRIAEVGQATTHLGVRLWMREERITGQTLRQVLSSGPLAACDVIRLGLQLMEALVLAEGAHIVHRDVKPDNIIFDCCGNFWLLDFGIARHLKLDSVTATSSPFGKMTLGYAPPEQCRNLKGDIESRADLFATAVTMYECATGQNPFLTPPPRDHLEILRRVELDVLPSILLPIKEQDSFRDLISAMTQKDRVHRPGNVTIALEWLRDIARQEQIT